MKTLIKHFIYPFITRREVGPNLYHHLRVLEERQYWPSLRIQEEQLDKLIKLLVHAYKNTDFYRKRFDKYGLNPDKFQDFDDLKKIPVLTKEDIRDYAESMIGKNFSPDDLKSSLSGGTTGLVTRFYMDKKCLAKKLAAVIWLDKWTDWDIGEWMSLIWPATLEMHGEMTFRTKLKNRICHRRITLAMIVIDEVMVKRHIEKIKKFKPTMVRGFPMMVTEVGKYILKNNLGAFSIKGIITTGETLYPHQRSLIEKAFECPVYDSYRTRENGPLGQECDHHKGFHVNSECVFLETIPFENGSGEGLLGDNGFGKVLVTDLLNYGMPFIRYEIGDIGRLSMESCSCGRGLPLLSEVGGRMVEMTYTPQGEKIPSITLIPNLIHSVEMYNRVQIVQDAFDHLWIRIENPRPAEEILNRQREVVSKIFGPKMSVSFEFVDEIPLLKSGKYSFIVCKIPQDQLKDI